MTTNTLFRPFVNAPDLSWFQRINWKWLLQRSPMLLLATVSSWGVGGFVMQSGKTPLPVGVFGGLAFDLAFLGVIALADQQLTKTRFSHVLYWILNIGAATTAALLNTLYYAGGKYADITPEAITHGVPFAIFGLLFALYYHDIMSRAIERELIELDQNRFKCPNCSRGFKSQAALHAHSRFCRP